MLQVKIIFYNFKSFGRELRKDKFMKEKMYIPGPKYEVVKSKEKIMNSSPLYK